MVDNLFVRNPIGLLIGHRASEVTDNVLIEGGDISDTLPRSFGIDVNPSNGPIRVFKNIIAHDSTRGRGAHGISLAKGTENVSVNKNIFYKWRNPILDMGSSNAISSNEVDQSGYTDPNRNIDTYSYSIGRTATLASFMTEARKQSKDNWRAQYTAAAVNTYIRNGFSQQLLKK